MINFYFNKLMIFRNPLNNGKKKRILTCFVRNFSDLKKVTNDK